MSFERAMKKIQHVSVRTVWDDVTAEYEELRRETEVQRADSMALENARLDQLFSKALSLFSKGDVPAGRLAVAVMGRRAKLNGLDAPTKIRRTARTIAVTATVLDEPAGQRAAGSVAPIRVGDGVSPPRKIVSPGPLVVLARPQHHPGRPAQVNLLRPAWPCRSSILFPLSIRLTRYFPSDVVLMAC